MAKPQAKTSSSSPAALVAHADKRDTIKFSEVILHGKMRFEKGMVARFEDPAAAAYFDIAFNGTEFTDEEPSRVVTDDEINFHPDDPSGNETIDPHTIIGPGREGITPGTTVHQHALGEEGSGDATLKVNDVVADSKTEL